LHSKICWWRKSAFSVDIANTINCTDTLLTSCQRDNSSTIGGHNRDSFKAIQGAVSNGKCYPTDALLNDPRTKAHPGSWTTNPTLVYALWSKAPIF
jgi:hypothetical protein